MSHPDPHDEPDNRRQEDDERRRAWDEFVENADTMDYYEDYFEWIVRKCDGGWKDYYIQKFEDCWRFEDYLFEKFDGIAPKVTA